MDMGVDWFIIGGWFMMGFDCCCAIAKELVVGGIG